MIDHKTFPEHPGVYYILNLKNNKMYIGQSEDLRRRAQKHLTGLRMNTHPVPQMREDWARDGEDAFEFGVLTTVVRDSNSQRHSVERIFTQVYQTEDPSFGYNTSRKGSRFSEGILSQQASDAVQDYRARAGRTNGHHPADPTPEPVGTPAK